jgi:SAM-dependent methyltransferase
MADAPSLAVDPRRDLLLAGVPRHARIVEVGASFRPLVAKRDGWNTCVVDHDTRAGLLAKYAAAAVDPAEIEEVDVVWRTGPLHEAFAPEDLGSFDAVVASHVLEHMPDLVAFLDSCRRLVHDDGMLIFALPDKRWCFDFFRPTSLAGDVLLAHHEHRTLHSAAVLFNEVAYSMTLAGRPGWAAGELAADLAFAHEPGKARVIFDQVSGGDPVYRDAHAWQFTPASFELLVLDLAQAGACDWQVDWVQSAAAVEFLGRLRPGTTDFPSAEALQSRRKQLLLRLAAETLDQLQTVLASPPAACPPRPEPTPEPSHEAPAFLLPRSASGNAGRGREHARQPR